MRPGVALALSVSLSAVAANVRADPTSVAIRALGASAVEAFAGPRPAAALVRLPATADPFALGLRPIAPGLAILEGDGARIAGFAKAHPAFPVELPPPLLPKLDRSVPFVGAGAPRLGAIDGTGTYVGIVDTGVDVFHDDFRNADGTTRIAWFLDFAQAPRPGNALDQQYGGRVFTREELDAFLRGLAPGDPPGDDEGHGTHVAGIAAGNGGPAHKYVGVAPGAELVVVRAADAFGNIAEARAIAGAKFVFDRAADAKKPAVVNLSLGTQYGAHDGSSSFERGLVGLVQGPGRAIVVAASNEGAFAIHTSVRVSPGPTYRIPIELPGANGKGAPYTDGQVFAWVNLRDGGDVRVGARGPDGAPWIAPLSRGQAGEVHPSDGLQVIVANDKKESSPDLDGTIGALLFLRGRLPVGVVELELEGDGAVEIWLQGARQAIDGPGMPGFARGAQVEGTVGVPASAAGLIAIGCVESRTGFVDAKGEEIEIGKSEIGKRCVFSSSGPSATGAMRPDLLAPGYYVISSMSRSLAALVGRGIDEKQVVDASHAALAGTSMSTPFGTGAIALLFQRDPTLTQEDARALLQAGARPVNHDTGADDYAKGAGILDVEGALAALDRKAKPPRATSLQMRLGASYLAAEGALPLYVIANARDESGRPADVEGGLVLETDGANVREPLDHPAVGLYRFAVVAASGRGATNATLRLKGAVTAERSVPIAVDRWDAKGVHGAGGCGYGGRGGTWLGVLSVLGIGALARARSRSYPPV